MNEDQPTNTTDQTNVHSPLKKRRIDQDPDYNEAAPPDVKRLKILENNGK